MTVVFAALAGAYLVVTLSSTGLAKLRHRRAGAVSLIAERVIPGGVAYVAIIAISITELTVATSVAVVIRPLIVGFIAAGMFLAFGIYRILSSVRTGRVSCSCAGVARSHAISATEILGVIVASTIQVAAACAWAFLATPGSELLRGLLVIVGAIPIAFYLMGEILGPKVRNQHETVVK